VLKLTYGNVELNKCSGGITPDPHSRGVEGSSAEGMMGLSPPITNSWLCPGVKYILLIIIIIIII